MPVSKDDIIESLRHELDLARTQIANLKHEATELRARVGGTIVQPISTPAVLPSADQMQSLLGRVFARYPRLRPDREHKTLFDAAFPVAFRYFLFCCTRTDKQSKYSVETWSSRIEQWAERRNLYGGMSMAGLTAAIVAHNVNHTYGPAWPREFSFALLEGGDGLGDSGWRAVLAGSLCDPQLYGPATIRAPVYETQRPTQRELIDGAWRDVEMPNRGTW